MPPTTIGPYRIERLIGEGGMGSVYEGVHEATTRRVAIKVLHAEYARDATMTGRFFNEARAVNKIEHRGIVQVFDYGRQDDGSAYIAMELFKGESLSRRLERGPRIRPVGEALRLGWQIADALAAAHENGIVHRDLKPDNIMIIPDTDAPGGERTKLLDFGIAKLVEGARGDQPKTQTKVVMGTPQYMSPEQCKSARLVDDKTDVYALGVMLFELLSGRTPFVSESSGEYIGMHLFKEPPRLGELMPNLPADLAAQVDTMLRKDKNERPTMLQVVAALAQFVRRYGTPSFQSEQLYSLASREAIPIPPRGVVSTLGRSIGQLGRRTLAKGPLVGGLAVLALLIGAAIGLRIRSGREDSVHVQTEVHSGGQADHRAKVESSPPLNPVPVSLVRWSIRTTPTGATVVDSQGQVLGHTPWLQSVPKSTGIKPLSLRLSGYADKSVTLDGGADADRQERLRQLVPAGRAAGPKNEHPANKPAPAKIDYEP